MGGGSSGGGIPAANAAAPPVGQSVVNAPRAGAETLLTQQAPNLASLTFKGKAQTYRTNLAPAIPETALGADKSNLLYTSSLGEAAAIELPERDDGTPSAGGVNTAGGTFI